MLFSPSPLLPIFISTASHSQEVDVGLAADIGTLQRFPKIVSSASLARELCFTGRRFGAIEAEGMGFVSKVVPGGSKGVEEEAVRMGGVIAGKSPVAVLGTKNILNCESRFLPVVVGEREEEADHIPNARDPA